MTLAELIKQDSLRESGLTGEVKEELTKKIYDALRNGREFFIEILDIKESRVDWFDNHLGKYSIVRIAHKDDYALRHWLDEQGLHVRARYGARGIHLLGYEISL